MDRRFSLNRFSQRLKKYSRKKLLFAGTSVIALLAFVFYLPTIMTRNESANLIKANDISHLSHFKIFQPTIKYGFILDTFQVTTSSIQSNQFLGDILDQHRVPYQMIDQLARNSKDIFDVRKLRVGKEYMILAKDTVSPAEFFIYEPDVFSYVIYDLKNASAKVVEREVVSETQTASGIIESSLWQTMVDNDLSYELASRLEDVFGWSIDFYHIQKGDQFKVIYEQKYIDGKPVGVGDISAGYYKNFDNEYYGVYFENEKHSGFYDLEARPMKKNFLKSPVKYSRISSRFNLNRFHPILKRRKAHLGTDYAAPYGTPILAVADGVVTKASRTRGNGNFVKIKHDKTHQTQYLHMQKFAKGVRSGVHVKQGQTIGYVGSTGLATGPHVCFRFWKNGRQVNHLRLNFPPPDPMPKEDIPRFNEVRDELVTKLKAIQFKQTGEMESDKKENEKGEVNP